MDADLKSMNQERRSTAFHAATGSRSLVRVLDRDWQPGRSNFGGGNWMLYLECGHVEWRKASAGTPLKIKCPDCARGRTTKDPEWLAKYPENVMMSQPTKDAKRSDGSSENCDT